MCGITGIWTRAHPSDDLEKTVCAMRDRIRRRGPDDAGVWVDADQGVALGHRRLSIIDLSPGAS
jgi:asparagine synthase (glutamine-hydrolysing)